MKHRLMRAGLPVKASKRRTSRRAPPERLTVADIEAAIGEPAVAWAGRCMEIASQVVASGLVDGVAIYGHWTGPIHSQSLFAGRPFTHHGWVKLTDGRVLDPTRWVFEHVAPYVFVGEPAATPICAGCDHIDDEHGHSFFAACQAPGCECPDFEPQDEWPYDEGGDRLRRRLMQPPPAFNLSEPLTRLSLSPTARVAVTGWLKTPGVLDTSGVLVCRSQLFWLANLPYDMLGPWVGEIYGALIAAGRAGAIPIDNVERARREGALAPTSKRARKVRRP